MPVFNTKALKEWFLENKRDFPWRNNINPYSVWVSEVMLQQTRAEVVVPYFLKWMERFPDISSLAKSPIEEIIKYWEGLGYYSRARNLHLGAKNILDYHGGKVPDNPKDLMQIKGLGPYTVSAILSFAFHKKAFPLDGNAIRVLTRLFAISDDVTRARVVNNLRELGETLLPNDDSWTICEAIIELGAVICTKKPQCHKCPLKDSCAAYQNDSVLAYPFKSKKIAITSLKRAVAVFVHQKSILMRKELAGKVMADLYEFPYFEIEESLSLDEFREKVEQQFDVKVLSAIPLEMQRQSFTRYRVELQPFLCHVQRDEKPASFQWLSREQLKLAALSSGHRKVLASVEHLLL